MSKISTYNITWQHALASALTALLAVLNIVLLVVLLVVRPEGLFLLLIRTVFALLLSLYALFLTRELQNSANRRAGKVLAIITGYALVASAVFLGLVGNLPWWMTGGQWITVVIYVLFGLVLASILIQRKPTA